MLPGGKYGVANDVNNAGVMVGEADGTTDRGLRTQPVIWHADGNIEAIPLYPLDPPLDMGFAEGINERGAVIGWDMSSIQGDGRQVPWIRKPDGTKSNLNDLIDPASGWDLRVPLDINDRGQIVGIGILTVDGVTYEGRAFLLTPTASEEPIPTELSLTTEGRGNKKALVATLTEAPSGEAVSGREVSFQSNGELIGSATTSSDGSARLLVPPGHRGANRTMTASFVGDELYAASTT